MRPNTSRHVLVSACAGLGLALLAAGPAAAHTPGAPGVGLGAGLAHPLAGLDHLLAAVAVGLWAAQLGGRALWHVPAAFVAALALGGGLALAAVPLPAVEPGIAASLLVTGLLVASAARLPNAAGVALAAAFALFHGHAHGTEMPAAAAPASYALGLALATAALQGAGAGLAVAARRLALPALVRAGGGAVAAAGLALLAAG